MDKFLVKYRRTGHNDSASACSSVSDTVCDNGSSVKDSVNSTLIGRPTKLETNGRRRTFKKHWKNSYSWILHDEKEDKVFCSLCKSMCDDNKLSSNTITTNKDSYNAFVKDGFKNWSVALRRFKSHEKGNLHRCSISAKNSIEKGINVLASISHSKSKEMQAATICLKKIFTSILFLVCQGLALRGHVDESSNFHNLLKLRSEDVPELKLWLNQTSYKWMSHDIINEIITLLSMSVQRILIKKIKESDYFSLMLDETCDISVKEQMSVCFRTVDKNFDIHELFCGFYELPLTDSDTLFRTVKDIFLRYSLSINNCRGQCYDGARNMSGCLIGLQSRIKEVEPRAIHIHCLAHSLNLVVQDSFNNISIVRDALSILKDLIFFIRGSPKRLEKFKGLKNALSDSHDTGVGQGLRPFCPTRWCLRVVSLVCLENNYEVLLKYFKDLQDEKSDAGAKAKGFLEHLQKFESLFTIKMLIFVFQRIEKLNSELQKVSLNYRLACTSVDTILSSIKGARNTDAFLSLWKDANEKSHTLQLSPPKLSRPRKIPLKLGGGETCNFSDIQEKFRVLYYEVVDQTITSLKTRFPPETMSHLVKMEQFLLGLEDNSYVISKYGDDFDGIRLTLHRDILLDVIKQHNVTLNSFESVVQYLSRADDKCVALKNMIPEYVKLLKLLLTLPVSICTAERSFSALRRLKTYTRSTMNQDRLNHVALLNVHCDLARELNVDEIVNEFISKTAVRRNTFQVLSS